MYNSSYDPTGSFSFSGKVEDMARRRYDEPSALVHEKTVAQQPCTTKSRKRIKEFFESPAFQEIMRVSGKSEGFIYVLICDIRFRVLTTTLSSNDQ